MNEETITLTRAQAMQALSGLFRQIEGLREIQKINKEILSKEAFDSSNKDWENSIAVAMEVVEKLREIYGFHV